MEKPLAGQVALISGGARGIGAACARKLAKAGASVAINYFNSSDVAERLCSELDSYGVDAIAIKGNVADPESVKELFVEFSARFDHLNILISNAASGVLKPALKMKQKHWHWCMDTNALALTLLTQQAKPLMPKGGKIIAMSSLGSIRAIPNYAFIGASKAALESLVRSLALELAPDDIAVNCISAGVVDTDALSHFPNRDFLIEQFKERSFTGETMTPENVADAAYLLCLPEAHLIRGQVITVDAGYSIIG